MQDTWLTYNHHGLGTQKSKPIIAFFEAPLASFEPSILLTNVKVLVIKRNFLSILLLYLKHQVPNSPFFYQLTINHCPKCATLTVYSKISKTVKRKQKILDRSSKSNRVTVIK